jgi:hypothetical protein
MSKPAAETNRDFWLTQARRVARRVNLAWWLETLSAPLLIAAILGAAAILAVRNRLPEISPIHFAAAIAVGVLLLAITCWLIAARRFEKPARSLVRLEATMQLHNALSAASAGVGPWPAPVEKTAAGLRWHWPRLIVPPLGALVLLAAGIFIPISAARQNAAPPEQPQAWKQIDATLDHLAKEEAVDETYLEETRKKLEELRAQKEEQWFSHSSLEATDALKKEHRSEMERVERELDHAEKALDAIEKNSATANQAEKDRQLNDYQQALNNLQNGAMKPNPQLLEKMQQFKPGETGQLSKEQMQQLRENLKKNADAMKNTPGQTPGDDWSDELLGDQNGEGQGKGQGDKPGGPGPGRGQGDPDRGPGHDPTVLGDEKNGIETGDLTGINSQDLSRALPGDLLELQNGEHDIDKSASKISQGGNTNATGAGGDRVWKESLDPAEQRTLHRYFK